MMRLARSWPALIGVAALAWVAFSFNWPQAVAALGRVRPWPLLLWLALICLAMYTVSAARWIAINQLPWRGSVIRNVHAYVAVTIAIGLVTPMQVGEALKVRYAQKAGLQLGAAVAKLLLERLLDLACVVALGASGVLHRLGMPPAPSLLPILLPLLVLALPAVASYWMRAGSRFVGWIGPPLPAGALAVVAIATAAKWVVAIISWLLLLAEVGVELSVWEGMLLVAAVALAGIVSMVPGGLGVQEASVAALLVGMGYLVSESEAGALALRLLLPVMLLVGLAHWPLLRRRAGPG